MKILHSWFYLHLFNLSQFCNLSSSLLACSHNNFVSLWVLRIFVTTVDLSLIFASFIGCCKDLCYAKIIHTSTHTIFATLLSQHIVCPSTETALLKVVSYLFFLLAKAACLCKLCLNFLQYLRQMIALSLYTVSMITLDLLILSSNGSHIALRILPEFKHCIISFAECVNR